MTKKPKPRWHAIIEFIANGYIATAIILVPRNSVAIVHCPVPFFAMFRFPVIDHGTVENTKFVAKDEFLNYIVYAIIYFLIFQT